MNKNNVEEYLIQYVGECFEIEESAEKIFVDKDFPDEYTNLKQRLSLKGANRKAKANAAQGIPELIKIATNPVLKLLDIIFFNLRCLLDTQRMEISIYMIFWQKKRKRAARIIR